MDKSKAALFPGESKSLNVAEYLCLLHATAASPTAHWWAQP